MRIADMNWMQVQDYLENDDRCVLPLGSTEQHAFLSLATDNILAEKMALDAAEPLNIPVFPPVNYGITPYFRAYPGTISLRMSTYFNLIEDILNSMDESGFRRVLIVNGHGGNSPAQAFIGEWQVAHPHMRIKFHNWWNATKTWNTVTEIDPMASHASWSENFPWTRLEGVTMPEAQKTMADMAKLRLLPPQPLRDYLGDGSYGGYYQRPDTDTEKVWDVAVEETRALLTESWNL